jgi:hypothetical protein
LAIRIKCVCGARLKAPDSCIGRSVRCSICGDAVYVPNARGGQATQHANEEVQAWIRVVCDCGKVIKSPPEWAGKKGHCPRCGLEHVMPTSTPSDVPGEHEVGEVLESQQGRAPDKPPATPAETDPAVRTPPHPQPRPNPVVDEPADDETNSKYVSGQTLDKSGLLDLTGQEDVKILDGVAPALWDAKRAQRAKALRAGQAAQTGYYRRRAFTEQLAHIRKRIDEVLYRSPALTLVIIGGVLLGASLCVFSQLTGASVREDLVYRASKVYFYDLSTGELFVHTDADPPPIHAPHQTGERPAGCRAHVFSCGDCNDPASRFVGYLEMYDPHTDAAEQFKRFRQLMVAHGPSVQAAEAEDRAEAGRLVSSGKEAAWVAAGSEQGRAIIARGAARDCDSGQTPTKCIPPAP